jgi:hypothetical protein
MIIGSSYVNVTLKRLITRNVIRYRVKLSVCVER